MESLPLAVSIYIGNGHPVYFGQRRFFWIFFFASTLHDRGFCDIVNTNDRGR